MKKSKLIVIEGTDGAGKSTQISLLRKYLDDHKHAYETVDFPRYEESFFGALVARYLKGEFGETVDAHLAALPYALDRWQAKTQITQWLNNGKLVIADRYASASRGHMAARIPASKREAFLSWLRKLEYEELQVPKEDVVIFLYLKPEIAHKRTAREGRTYLAGQNRDIHEKDIEHIKTTAEIFLSLAKEEYWQIINCDDGNEQLSRKVIHQNIVDTLRKRGIL